VVSPNWGLLGGNNALGMFQLGAQIGGQVRQQRDERRERNALTAYANDPTDANLGAIAEYNPEFVIRQRQGQAMAAREGESQRRDQLPVIGRILGTIKDEASYQQAIGMAQRYGIDVSDAPQSYDPAWVQSTRDFATAMGTPEGQQKVGTAGQQALDEGFQQGTPEFYKRTREIFDAGNVRTVPYQAGGGVASVNTATGVVTPLIVPGYGGGSGLPGTQSGPQAGAVEDGYRFKGGDPADPASWEPVGGGGGNVTSNFLSGV
jgi:hypothetical protein